MTALHIALLIQFIASNVFLFGSIYLLHKGFKNKALLGFQHWLSPLKVDPEANKMYNYIITMYDAGVLTASLGTDGILRFTEDKVLEDDEKPSVIELYCLLPYYGAFNIRKFRDSNKVVNAKPNFEIFKRLVDIHYDCIPTESVVVRLD